MYTFYEKHSTQPVCQFDEDMDFSANCVTKGLACQHCMLQANVCGLQEMCYQELVNIVLAEAHTRERQE